MLRSIAAPLVRGSKGFARSAGTPVAVRFFSNVDGHSDFQPQRKTNGLDEVVALVKKQVESEDVMLYMKGTPNQPQCGFSLQAVRILNSVGVEFSSVNVLEYPAIREGVKVFSDWPTIPQLYVKGEFVGGCDIMTSMLQDGELEKLLKEKKLIE